MNRNCLSLAILASFALLVSACAPKKTPTRASTQHNAGAPVMDDVTQRMTELQKLAAELSTIAKNLPGRDTTEDRTLTADAFDRAGAAITLLGGPEPGGALRQQLRIIDNVRQGLRNNAVSSTYDPSVDSGLRSLGNALDYVHTHLFQNDMTLQKQLDALQSAIDDLDSVRGPLHAVAAAHAFQSASQVITTMANQLDGRTTTTSTQP